MSVHSTLNVDMAAEQYRLAQHLHNVQRAVNHLTAVIAAWNEIPEAERRGDVETALRYLVLTEARS